MEFIVVEHTTVSIWTEPQTIFSFNISEYIRLEIYFKTIEFPRAELTALYNRIPSTGLCLHLK